MQSPSTINFDALTLRKPSYKDENKKFQPLEFGDVNPNGEVR
jgi:hypothetical protein